MRRWIDLLSEAPISITAHDFNRDADGDMYNSFGPADRKLMRSPKAVAKIQKKWETSAADLNLFLLNTDKSPAGSLGLAHDEDHRLNAETAAVDAGMELDPNAINCLLTNNYAGSVEYPLTAWMIGHRLWHAITIREKMFYYDGFSTLEKAVSEIGNAYTCGDGRTIACKLGRSRACREMILTNYTELLPETFAEFLLFGQVRLNKMPDMFMDASDYEYRIREDNYGGQHWHDIVEEKRVAFEQYLNRHHAEVIQHAIGNVYTF